MDIGKYLIELPEELVQLMLKGDPRCPIKIGEEVILIRNPGEESVIPIGTPGKVIGNLWRQEPCWSKWGYYHDLYYVRFQGFDFPIATAGFKITKILAKA